MTLAASRFDLHLTSRCLQENRAVAREVECAGTNRTDTQEAQHLVALSEAVFENVVREYLRKLFTCPRKPPRIA